MSDKWGYIYGNECDELWEHFDMKDRSSEDRIKVKLIDFEEGKDEDI